MRRLRFVTDPTVLGQTSRILGHLPPSPGPNVIHHRGCINAACWSPNGRQLFTGSDDRLVKVWECKTAEKGWEELFCVSTGHTNNIFQVKLQPGAEHNVRSDPCTRILHLLQEHPTRPPPTPTTQSDPIQTAGVHVRGRRDRPLLRPGRNARPPPRVHRPQHEPRRGRERARRRAARDEHGARVRGPCDAD